MKYIYNKEIKLYLGFITYCTSIQRALHLTARLTVDDGGSVSKCVADDMAVIFGGA